MSYIEKKLKEWLDKKIITKEEFDNILNYENHKNSASFKKFFSLGLLLIAAFSIGLGIISIIAANWDLIPGYLKFLFLFSLHFSILFLILKYQERIVIKESLIVLFIILFLAEIGLTSQVFHLGGKLEYAFFFWGILSFFPMLLSTSNYIPFFIFSICHISFIFILMNHYQWNNLHQIVTASYISFIIFSLLFYGSSYFLKLQNITKGLLYYMILFYFVNLIVFHLLWYYPDIETEYFTFWKLWNLFFIFIIFMGVLLLNKDFFFKNQPFLFLLYWILFSINYYFASFFEEALRNRILGTIFFIVLILFNAYYFLKGNFRGLFHLSIITIIFRLWIVYIELFKNLTFTGLGLIVFGTLIYITLYFYKIILKKIFKKEESL